MAQTAKSASYTAICPGTTADVEVGQTSELVSLADSTQLASGNALIWGSRCPATKATGSRQNGSAMPKLHAHLQQLRRLCAVLHRDPNISDTVRDACTALQSCIDEDTQ